MQIICVVCGVSLETHVAELPQSERPKAGTAGQQSRLAASLLAIFLGWLGVHKFYLNYNKEGLILVLCSIVGGILTFGVAFFAVAVFGLAEGIIYLSKSEKEFQTTYVLNKRPWF